jgi:hypothetical protein
MKYEIVYIFIIFIIIGEKFKIPLVNNQRMYHIPQPQETGEATKLAHLSRKCVSKPHPLMSLTFLDCTFWKPPTTNY